MIIGSLYADRRQVPFISLVPFLLIAFGLAWGILALFILLPEPMTRFFGELSWTPQSAWSFTPFFVASAAVSVIVTQLFNASRGSILLPMLFHFQLNNPIWPDAQPHDTFAFVAAAIVVFWINRKTMFSREGVVTEVIPQTESRMMPGDLASGIGTGS
jgi:hypothetical protein